MPTGCCSVPKCSARGGHKFPKDRKLRKMWVDAIRRDKWTPTDSSLVCRNHFTANDYTCVTSYADTQPQKGILKKDAVPSQFEWTKDAPVHAVARKDRYTERSFKKAQRQSEVVSAVPDDCPPVVGAEETVSTCDSDDICHEMSTQTDTVHPLEFSTQSTNTDTYPMMSVHRLKHSDEQVHYYTGLESYCKFMLVLNILGDAANELVYMYGPIHPISVEDQFLVVLMRLRRHRPNFELATLFELSEADVYNIFCTWIRFMSLQFKELGDWPDQSLVRFYSPSGFKREYPSSRVIVDGMEIPVKKPKMPGAQQATFSTYKNRNTVKVLVGVTPGGLVSYVSDSYAGSTSDRQITERSDLPQMCDPGDSVMSDKGFDVQDIFGPFDVKVNIPTFLRKCNQFSNETIMRDRKIASKRVHVERAIGLAKTFRILTEPLNRSELLLSSDIIYVTFMLCNLRQGIVPGDA